jgi:WD40 repeat protein
VPPAARSPSPSSVDNLWATFLSGECCAFSPDGKTLASGDEKGTIKLWDVPSGKELASFAGHAGEVLCLAISADGKVLAPGGQDKKIKLWDTVKVK